MVDQLRKVSMMCIKRQAAGLCFYCRMHLHAVVIILSLFALTASASDSDTVNERFSATGAEREAHWQVDCASAWQKLSGTPSGEESSCGVSPELRHQIQLCAFIYQPPGKPATAQCRDFAGVLVLLEKTGADANKIGRKSCANSLSKLIAGRNCETASP
jgi:hypothetical protein